VRRQMVAAGRLPTVQIAAAWAAALQVQEGIKVMHGRTDMDGRRISYVGSVNYFDIVRLRRRAECFAHEGYPEPVQLALSRQASLGTFLREICQDRLSGPGARLNLQGDREFLVEAECRRCRRPRPLMKPMFRLFENDLECPTARCSIYGDTP